MSGAPGRHSRGRGGTAPSVREGVDRARESALFEYVGGVREDSQIRAEKAVVLQATQVNVHPATETLVA